MAKVKEKKETKKVVKKVTNKEVKKVEDTKKTNEKDIKIIKRNGNKQEFDSSKIIAAILDMKLILNLISILMRLKIKNIS